MHEPMSTPSIDDIRRQIDALDDSLHDLLMQRAELVQRVGEERKRHKITPVQTARDAKMIRRLLARHKGRLPKEAIVRIWRELVGSVSLLQSGAKAVVCASDDPAGQLYWDMAKDYFSSVLPMVKGGNPMHALSMVREGEVTFAVLPWPQDGDVNPWWSYLLNEIGQDGMRVIARLPFGDRNMLDANPEHRALVVAQVPFEQTGDDRSFLALELDHHVSRARLVDRIRDLGLTPRSLYSADPKDGRNTLHLLEVDDYLGAGDARIATLLERLESVEGRCLCIGGYPTPPVYDAGNARADKSSRKAANG